MKVRGIVKDEDGVLLSGAHVVYVTPSDEYDNTKPATVTAPLPGVFSGGFFELPYLPGNQLRISFVGMESEYINLPVNNPVAPNDYFVEVDMVWDIQSLPPVTVTPDGGFPYGIILAGVALYFALND